MNQSHRYTMQAMFPLRDDVPFRHNALVQWIGIACILINVIVLTGLAMYVHPMDNLLKLQYNVYFGTSLYAPWWGVYVLPGIGIIFVMIDLLLAYILYAIRERIAAYTVLLGAFFAHIALAVASVSIILNNF